MKYCRPVNWKKKEDWETPRDMNEEVTYLVERRKEIYL
jgi:hypothetical protein